jgi:glycosyltransferase involved in cell wall biosynthesis
VTQTPVASFLVAAYNAAGSIRSCVDSLLQQVFRDLEVIVIDDASTDETQAVLACVEDPRLRVIRLENNAGRAVARNTGAQAARGEFLAVHDADDVSLPLRLDETLDVMSRRQQVIVASGQAVYVDRRLGRWRLREFPQSDGSIKERLLAGDMAVCHTASLIRKSAFNAVGGYDPALRRAQDFDLMRRLVPHGAFGASPKELVLYTHSVVLPYGYWKENRYYTRLVLGHSPTTPVDVLRYPVAMARRSLRYATSRRLWSS